MSLSDRPLVLIIMPLAEQRGGAELALLQLVGSKTPLRWHVVFLESGPMLQQCEALGVPATSIDAGRARQPQKMLAAVWEIARLAKQNNAGAILGWMAKAHIYGGIAGKLAGVPAGWFQHGLPTPGSWLDGLTNLLPATGAMACSQFSADEQLAVTPKLPMRVVHPAADLSRFNPDALPAPRQCREMLNLPTDGPLVGIFGRLQSWKGMHVLIEAMPKILAAQPNASALIVGGSWGDEATYDQQLHQLATRLGIAPRVIFAGQQNNVPHWMQACDVVVHASNREPFGMVVVEAMALGKPVVAGANGGPREAITDGVNGLLAPYGDANALANAVLKYLNDPAFAASVGEAARKRAQDFSMQRFTDGICDELNRWISATSPAPVGSAVHAE